MDDIYRYQRYIYDASRKYYLLGRDRMLDGLSPPRGGSVLEVGCGTGRNLVLTAARYPEARLYGFDISSMMIDTAQKAVVRAGIDNRAKLAEADASDFSPQALFGVTHFDRVFISYAVSMIPPWQGAVRCAFDAVAPGGSLHIVDFGGQKLLPRWFRAGLRNWLHRFSVTPRDDLERAMRALALEKGAILRFAHLYRDYAQYAVLEKPQEPVTHR